jgi:hypothetical protein
MTSLKHSASQVMFTRTFFLLCVQQHSHEVVPYSGISGTSSIIRNKFKWKIGNSTPASLVLLEFECDLYLWTGRASSVQRFVTDWTVRGSNPAGGEFFRTCPHWPWGRPSSSFPFPGVKRPERGVDHPPHLAPRLKKEYSYTSTPPLGLRGLF